jgi:hypothetical protein
MKKKITGLKIKDQIKTDVFPLVATILNKSGLSWKRLGKSKLSSSTLIAQGKNIAKTIQPEKITKPLSIYFLTMLGGHTHNVSVDIALAWGLKQKGHKIHFILDDQTLPIGEETKAGQENRWKELTAKSYNFGSKYIKACGFETLNVSDIIDVEGKKIFLSLTQL